METNYRISPFVELGRRLARQLAGGELDAVVARAIAENGWFTRQSVAQAIEAICTDLLDETVLRDWLARYPRPDASAVRRVGIVLAGNIPLVGFFDLLCVCICGHRCFVKPSSKDRVLTGYVVEQLLRIEPAMPVVPLEEDTPLDALIATGSDSTRSYFGKRYREMPSLLRGSRYSIAVLDGTETEAQLEGLSNDVFQYFGLGCRNVGRIFVPRGYDPTLLRDALSRYPMSHPGYLNNYRQARALRMLGGEPLLDGGFFLLRESDEQSPNLSEIGYAYYDDLDGMESWIRRHDDRLQCVVSEVVGHPRRVGFGRAQHPSPTDYPDGTDVIAFLRRI
ncbi:MAG: acyl-CoA reductase [Rikenellaceae bacterium]|nr:acyl-CoA reductase [Rikenellaceae bacterium]